MKKFDFKKSLSARAYTLMVCWRWKKIDEEIFDTKEYRKRSVESIQDTENTRMAMHKSAIEELTKIFKFTENESHKMLTDECERLINEKFGQLKSDEQFCGCCRVVLKTKDWVKHKEKNKLLHNYLAKELTNLNIEQTQLRMVVAKNREKKE